MRRTTKQTQPRKATPGFAIEIKDDTELGLAMLIAEFESGHYEPIGVVASIQEAGEIARDDLRIRMRDLEQGDTPSCPDRYVVWAQGLGGGYRQAKAVGL